MRDYWEYDFEEEWLEMQARPPRFPRRRAMVGLAVMVVLGTAAGLCLPISPLWFLGAGALLLLPLFLWIRHERSVWPLMGMAFFLVAAHAGFATGGGGASELTRALARPMEYIQVVVRVTEDAVGYSAQPGRGPGATFLAQVEGLNRDGSWVRVEERIRVVVRGQMDTSRLPRYGERWRLRGQVAPAVAKRKGIFATRESQAFVDADRLYFLDASRGNPFVEWCLARRRVCREILSRGLADFPEERGVLQTLLLGYREDLPASLRRDFAATGTVHIFAISGAHVGMLALLIAGLLRALKIPVTRWLLFMAPMLTVYVIATGAATSAIRAGIMAVLMFAAPFFNRKPDALSGLAMAAIIILLGAPAQLGDLGFILSFTAVLGLLALQPLFDHLWLFLFRRDSWQLPAQESQRASQRRESALTAARFGSVSVSAWLATAPLTAAFFNLVSPIALGMNLIVIPVAFCILLAGVLSLVCATFSSWMSETFNLSAAWLAMGLSRAIVWAAGVPGGHFFVRSPPWAVVAAWYGILFVTAAIARRVRWMFPVGLAFMVSLALGWWALEARTCRISVLQAGEGGGILIKTKSSHVLLDTGAIKDASDTLRKLRAEGVNQLSALILSHADARHIGAAPALLAALPIRELWVPERTWPSPVLKDILALAAQKDLTIRPLRAGNSGDWPGAMWWEVLWPPPNAPMACADDASLVLRVARGGTSVLLAGDAEQGIEKKLLASGRPLASSILVAGKHGDAEATSLAWLHAVRPSEIIFRTGLFAEKRYPDAEVLERLADLSVRTWKTDSQGTIHLELMQDPARWPRQNYKISAASPTRN